MTFVKSTLLSVHLLIVVFAMTVLLRCITQLLFGARMLVR